MAVTGTGHPLKESATIFLKFVEDNLEHVTLRAYGSAINPFVEHCKKPTLESVIEDDVLAFARWLKKGDVEHRRKPLELRTVFNRVCSLKTFFRYFKVPWPVEDIHMPTYTERVPTAYDPDQVRQLAKFATLDEAEWVAYMDHSGDDFESTAVKTVGFRCCFRLGRR